MNFQTLLSTWPGRILLLLALGFLGVFGYFVLRQAVSFWKVLQAIEKKDNTPNLIYKEFSKENPINPLCKEYNKILYRNSRGRLVASAPAEVIWNSQLAVDQPVRAEFFKHVPGIFTGLGIIGTFLGLIDGLKRFKVSSEADVVRASLESLMHTVGEAFVISAAAIICAIIATLIEKLALTYLYNRVDAIALALDQKFPVVAAENLLEKTVMHTEEAATQLKHLKGGLLGDLKPILQELSDNHSRTLGRLATALQDRFNEANRSQIDAARDHSQVLGSTISGAIAGSLAAPLNDIKTAVKQASGEQSSAAIEMLKDVMASFSQKLNDLFGGQISGINELNQRTAQTMQDAVTQLNELVVSLQDAGQRSSHSMAEHMIKAIAEMESRQTIITQNTQALVGQLRQAIEQSQKTTAEGVRSTTDEMAKRMAEAMEKMEQRQDSINERTREFVDQIKALVASSQSETSEKLQSTLHTLGDQLGTMLQSFQSAQNVALAAGQIREQETHERTQASVSELMGSVQALVQHIDLTSTKMQESITALRSTTIAAISGLNEGAGQVNIASSQLVTAFDKVSAAMYQASTVTTKLTDLTTSLTVAASSLQQGTQDYKAHRESVSQLVSDLNGLVANAKTDVSITSDVLRRIEAAARELSKAQGQTEQFMAGVARVLGQAHESFREEMLKTVRDNDHAFHTKLASAVGMISASIGDLDDVLSTVTLNRRSK